MAFKDYEMELRYNRCRNRTIRYGNWRQIYVNCNGVCVECGDTEELEFHEKCKGCESRDIVLLCPRCHQKAREHRGYVTINPRHYASRLQEDVAWEIADCGSRKAWMEKYNLTEREVTTI